MAIDIRIQIDLSARQKRIIRGAVVAGSVIGALGIGVAIAMPKHTFTSGTPIKATEMNDNFVDLDTRLGAVEATRTVAAVISNSCQGTAPWIQTIVPNVPAPGQDCTVVFVAGTFSAAPVCFGASNGVNGGTPRYVRTVVVAGPPTVVQARFQHVAGDSLTPAAGVQSGALDNEPFSIVCVGPK